MSQRLEIWAIPQKWMTINENGRKKKRKAREKVEENEKDENKKLNQLPDELET